MANVIKWETTPNSRGNVMTDTELSALANGAVSAASPAYDNTTNLDTWGRFQLVVDFVSAPTSGGNVVVYAVYALDGSNYATTTTTVAELGSLQYLTTIVVPANSAALRIDSPRFVLEPSLMKFILYNNTGQVFPTSASSVLKLFTFNDEIQ